MGRNAATLLADAAMALLLVTSFLLCYQVVQITRTYQQLTIDHADLSHVRHGLLDAGAWAAQVAPILERRIGHADLSGENRAAALALIGTTLDTLIVEGDRYLRARSRDGDPLERMTDGIRRTLLDIEALREGVPVYAERILEELEQSDSREQLQQLLRALLADLGGSRAASAGDTTLERVRARFDCRNRAACIKRVGSEIDRLDAQVRSHGWFLLCATAAAFLLALALGQRRRNRHLLALLGCGVALLLGGLLTPMIQVEARISDLRFQLFGETIVFRDEVLYFQSKSVLEVVRILSATGQAEMVLVGVLVVTFCLLFPLAKLAASLAWLADVGPVRSSRAARFFALESGKWSMADVFVVAMFMSYIGFNGLIDSQLSDVSRAAGPGVDVLTTNGTSLEIGFFLFLGFCLAGLASSALMATDAPGEKVSG